MTTLFSSSTDRHPQEYDGFMELGDYTENMEAPTVSQPISSLSLSDLQGTFGLTCDRSDPFFTNWQANADPLTDFKQQSLDRLRRNYENMIETNPLEEVVKLVVVAPLLDLADFY